MLLYEMLSLHSLTERNATIQEVILPPLLLRKICPDIPEMLENIVMKAIAINRSQCYIKYMIWWRI